MCTKRFLRPLARASIYRKLERHRSELKLANPKTQKLYIRGLIDCQQCGNFAIVLAVKERQYNSANVEHIYCIPK